MSVKRKLKRRKKPGRKTINLDMDQLDELIKRAESGRLQENDIELIKGMAECIAVLSQAVDDKASSVKKLLRMVFGAKTEKKKNVLGDNKKRKAVRIRTAVRTMDKMIRNQLIQKQETMKARNGDREAITAKMALTNIPALIRLS